jgi:hypothetical protein
MVDNRFLHNLAMERMARKPQIQNKREHDTELITEKVISSANESNDMRRASKYERCEKVNLHPDNEDLILSQSTARNKLESLLKFAEDAGLDKPSARIALAKSMGDEDRYLEFYETETPALSTILRHHPNYNAAHPQIPAGDC